MYKPWRDKGAVNFGDKKEKTNFLDGVRLCKTTAWTCGYRGRRSRIEVFLLFLRRRDDGLADG